MSTLTISKTDEEQLSELAISFDGWLATQGFHRVEGKQLDACYAFTYKGKNGTINALYAKPGMLIDVDIDGNHKGVTALVRLHTTAKAERDITRLLLGRDAHYAYQRIPQVEKN